MISFAANAAISSRVIPARATVLERNWWSMGDLIGSQRQIEDKWGWVYVNRPRVSHEDRRARAALAAKYKITYVM